MIACSVLSSTFSFFEILCSCLTASKQNLPIISGFLLKDDTSGHISFLEKPSMHPCNEKPNDYSLSWPSICQEQFGPALKYFLRLSFLRFLLDTPYGSYCKIARRTSSGRNFRPFFASEPRLSCIQYWIQCHLILPPQQPVMLHHQFKFSLQGA